MVKKNFHFHFDNYSLGKHAMISIDKLMENPK